MGGQKQGKSRSRNRNKNKKVKPSKSSSSSSGSPMFPQFTLFMNEDGELYYPKEDPGFMPEESDMESEEALWGLYLRWCRHFKQSRTCEELDQRFHNFKRNASYVFELNKKYNPSCQFTMQDWCDEDEEEPIEIADGDDRCF